MAVSTLIGARVQRFYGRSLDAESGRPAAIALNSTYIFKSSADLNRAAMICYRLGIAKRLAVSCWEPIAVDAKIM